MTSNSFGMGALVTAHGLKGAHVLNGKWGRTVTKLDSVSGRIGVRFACAQSRTGVKVKMTNLTQSTLSEMEASTYCWACGLAPQDNIDFAVCEQCRSSEPPNRAVYCSEECAKVDVENHSRWHAERATAEDVLKLVRQTQGEYEALLFHANSVLLPQSKTDEAIERLNEAIRIHPKRPKAYLRLAEVLQQAGREEDRKDTMEKVLSIHPSEDGSDEWVEAVTCVWASLQHDESAWKPPIFEDPNQMRRIAEEVTTKAPLNRQGWLMLGTAMGKSDDPTENAIAAECYETAARLVLHDSSEDGGGAPKGNLFGNGFERPSAHYGVEGIWASEEHMASHRMGRGIDEWL